MSNFQGKEDGKSEVIQSRIQSESITVITATASWTPNTSGMLTVDELKGLFSNPEELVGSSSKLGSFIFLSCDDEEDTDIAVDLDITEFPCIKIYRCGKALRSLSGVEVSKKNVQLALKQVIDETQLLAGDDMLRHVQESYAGTVKKELNCCGSTDSKMNNYSMEELMMAGAADLGLGCGNPLSFAPLVEGAVLYVYSVAFTCIITSITSFCTHE